MTRDEAIAKCRTAHRVGDGAPAQFVDLAVALGMLTLDEPKTARHKFVEHMIGLGYYVGSTGMTSALDAFDASQK